MYHYWGWTLIYQSMSYIFRLLGKMRISLPTWQLTTPSKDFKTKEIQSKGCSFLKVNAANIALLVYSRPNVKVCYMFHSNLQVNLDNLLKSWLKWNKSQIICLILTLNINLFDFDVIWNKPKLNFNLNISKIERTLLKIFGKKR